MHTPTPRPLARRTALLLTLLCLPVVAPSARAAWPPPLDATSADLADPANWPNDPSYGWTPDGGDGQWNYYSFMVPNSNVRPDETATGMSIDLAWRHTLGDPRVIIAVHDSGIKWDEDDIIEAAFINHRELRQYRPTNADSTPCGNLNPTFYPGQPPEDLAGFDCNGDGIVSVADYAASPALTPPAEEGFPLGDRNRNGRLDAGDLIMNFSDGDDDDTNGYIDDISGWDFMKDDNDPYDDTRYGHGTGEARDSTSRANNGMGTAGGCNQCRLLNIRVGDSFITDVNDFAQGVVYSVDMKARVIQSALGTVNNNRFTQAALDYAWNNGTLMIASMADENSRHHNMPTASNHTLPVHAIQYSGENITEARTFLEYHPCSNYGGQNFLSASGLGCSSEATGQLSGILGLVFSKGIQEGVDLTAGEAMQILMMSADDINVPESQQPGAIDRWSHLGFDQRFGYGRANANRAVEMVRDRRIPPEVDVTSPPWFAVLYADQVTGPVDIVGTVAAKRSNGYDYVVQWAPGVQPLEGEFKTIQEVKNVPPDTVMGGTQPLASIDVRNLSDLPIPPEKWDIDSPHGENQYTITVRVRAVAHYGGEIGDVTGELRRTYAVHQDPTLLKGFPLYVGDSLEGSPKAADLDGDGVRELVYITAGGELLVYKITPQGPTLLPGFPFRVRRMDGLNPVPMEAGEPSYVAAAAYTGGVDPDLGRESITTSAPAIADLDGDGRNEIVFITYAGTLYVVGSDAEVLPGWPKRLPRIPSCSRDPMVPVEQPCMSTESRIARGAFAAPVLEDMDGDGTLDIVQAAFDGKVYVFHTDGSDLDGFPVTVLYDGRFGGEVPPPDRVFPTPAVADLNGDGVPDLVVGSNQGIGEGDNSGAVYVVDGRGTNAPSVYLPNWPITMTSLAIFPLVAEGITNAPVVASFGGIVAAVVHGNASPPLILPGDPGNQPNLNAYPPNLLPQRDDQPIDGLDYSSTFGPLTTAQQPNTMLPLFSNPALGDMDQDGMVDVLSSGGSLNLAIGLQSATTAQGDNLLAMWSGRTGKMMPASPMVIEDFTFFNSSSVADLSGDGYPEAIIGTGGYYVHALDGCGREAEGFPKFTGQWMTATPVVADVDGDGTLDVSVGTRSGWIYAWRTKGRAGAVVEWESFHHDNRNTGNYDVPLEQSGAPIASAPLTEASCLEPGGDDDGGVGIYPSGGCACRAAGAPSSRAVGGAFALLGLAALAARAIRRRGDAP
jgi:MYXO-CTERM domain-containing protein